MQSQKKLRPPIDGHILESICKIIADTQNGITGSEIQHLLSTMHISDVDSTNTKWKRLYNAFVTWQNKNQCSNNILDFIKCVMAPARYIGKEADFHSRRNELNKAMSFIGTEITERGTLASVNPSTTISEAEQRAQHFKYKLQARNIHPEIERYCISELLQENYFHSVFEATKSIADRIRSMTGLYADGNALADTAFSTNNPLIRINRMANDTERSEHIGLMNLVKGVFGAIRNPTAHSPKIHFVIEENEALDIMTVISYIHKKLDNAI
jgi:uncharacterized protein (TIGR02391 family)